MYYTLEQLAPRVIDIKGAGRLGTPPMKQCDTALRPRHSPSLGWPFAPTASQLLPASHHISRPRTTQPICTHTLNEESIMKCKGIYRGKSTARTGKIRNTRNKQTKTREHKRRTIGKIAPHQINASITLGLPPSRAHGAEYLKVREYPRIHCIPRPGSCSADTAWRHP